MELLNTSLQDISILRYNKPMIIREIRYRQIKHLLGVEDTIPKEDEKKKLQCNFQILEGISLSSNNLKG